MVNFIDLGNLNRPTVVPWKLGINMKRSGKRSGPMHLITSNAEDLIETLTAAIEALEQRQLGWLEFRTEQSAPEVVSVFARVNLGKAFLTDTPTGLTTGGDVQGRWGTLDDSVWTPPVRVKGHPRVPPRLRGRAPMRISSQNHPVTWIPEQWMTLKKRLSSWRIL